MPETAGALNTPSPSSEYLFFSEYVEGSSNNKALELFNNTGGLHNLDDYIIQFYFNGNTTAGTTINLPDVNLAADGTWVVADDGADAAILAVADQLSGANFFNGNDAIVLRHATAGIVDSIGDLGFDPGTQWLANGVGTRDASLRRKPTVFVGDYQAFDPFDPSLEWLSAGRDNFSDLGRHSFAPAPLPQQTITPPPLGVPEPLSLSLLALGLLLLAMRGVHSGAAVQKIRSLPRD